MSRRFFQLVAIIAVFAVLVVSLSGQTYALGIKEISPDGGIGNTRQNVLREWGPLHEMTTEPQIVGQQQMGYYTTGSEVYFLNLVFQLEKDGEPRDTDRVTMISAGYEDPMSQSAAERIVAKYLPADADLVKTQTNHYGNVQQIYSSKSIKAAFPYIFWVDEERPSEGYIWVTYEPYSLGDSRIGAIEIALFNDEV